VPGSLVFLHLSRGLAGPALWMPVFTCLLSPDVFLCWVSLHFYPCVLVVTGSPDVCLHLSPFICLSVWLVVFGSLGASLYLIPAIWLPFWLVVSGSLDVSLRLSSFICPTLSSGVRLSGCLLCAFTCLWPCGYGSKLGTPIIGWLILN